MNLFFVDSNFIFILVLFYLYNGAGDIKLNVDHWYKTPNVKSKTQRFDHREPNVERNHKLPIRLRRDEQIPTHLLNPPKGQLIVVYTFIQYNIRVGFTFARVTCGPRAQGRKGRLTRSPSQTERRTCACGAAAARLLLLRRSSTEAYSAGRHRHWQCRIKSRNTIFIDSRQQPSNTRYVHHVYIPEKKNKTIRHSRGDLLEETKTSANVYTVHELFIT